MSIALSVAALFTAFVTFSGYIFGQLWFNEFSVVHTVIGVAGLVASAGVVRLEARPYAAPAWSMWSSLVAVLGIVADATTYYVSLKSPGNSYAWEIQGPLIACLCFIGFTARYRMSNAPTEA